LHVFTALHEMILGRAGGEEWRDLADAINIVKALCELGKLDEQRYMPHVTCALGRMVEASRALKASGTATLDAPALLALREVVTAYDDAIGRFAAQTVSAARARVVLTIANANKKLLVRP
jgi:hypothetical protein